MAANIVEGFARQLNGVGAPLAGLVRSTRLMPSLVSILMFGLLLGVVIGRYVW